PYYSHPRLKFIPNIIVNLISFAISFAVVAGLVFLLLRYLTNKFYHLN
ncbi:MAG: putative membrane protein, partial [Flavobacterium sp.]